VTNHWPPPRMRSISGSFCHNVSRGSSSQHDDPRPGRQLNLRDRIAFGRAQGFRAKDRMLAMIVKKRLEDILDELSPHSKRFPLGG